MAFTAVLSQNSSITEDYVILDKVLLNAGNAYNSTTGVFTCPDTDLYMFTWGGVHDVGRTGLWLHVNDVDVQHTWLTNTGSSSLTKTSGTSGNAYMLRCSTGTRVQLFIYENTLLADYTFFTGYKLPNQ